MTYDAQIAMICTQAKIQTETLLQKYPQFSQQEIYNVIKIMMMPIHILISSFKTLEEA